MRGASKMADFIKWGTRVAVLGVFILLGWNVWLAISTYQTMNSEQIQVAQQKEEAERAQFEQQMQASGESGERPHKRGFSEASPYRELKGALKDVGGNAVILVWIALSFWLVIEAMKHFASKTTDSMRTYFRKLIAYLREHHRVIGWLAFGLTAAHSLYYLALWWFKSMQFETVLLWSGIVSFVAFLFLALWGEWLQWHGRDKNARKVHWAMSLIMVGGMLVHDFGSLGKILIIIGAFVAFYIVSQLIRRWKDSKVQVVSE